MFQTPTSRVFFFSVLAIFSPNDGNSETGTPILKQSGQPYASPVLHFPITLQ